MSSTDRARSRQQGKMTTRLSARMRDRAATVGFLCLLVAFIGLMVMAAVAMFAFVSRAL